MQCSLLFDGRGIIAGQGATEVSFGLGNIVEVELLGLYSTLGCGGGGGGGGGGGSVCGAWPSAVAGGGGATDILPIEKNGG